MSLRRDLAAAAGSSVRGCAAEKPSKPNIVAAPTDAIVSGRVIDVVTLQPKSGATLTLGNGARTVAYSPRAECSFRISPASLA